MNKIKQFLQIVNPLINLSLLILAGYYGLWEKEYAEASFLLLLVVISKLD